MSPPVRAMRDPLPVVGQWDRPYRRTDARGQAGSILVVCTGNVCRSPYIERRLRHELAGTGIEVTSAGTRALVGHDMDAGTP